jgi:hypothetical protein
MRKPLFSSLILCLLTSCMHHAADSTAGPIAVPTPGCTTVFNCSQAAVQAAQNASASADRASAALPVGTIVAFTGTVEQAAAQRQYGWWVANGDTVTDASSAQFFGKKLPDLTGRFVLGASTAGQLGGSTTVTVPSQNIISQTTGGWGPNQVTSDPFTHMQGAHSASTDASIQSQGTYGGANLSLPLPPYYAVIYLVKVR